VASRLLLPASTTESPKIITPGTSAWPLAVAAAESSSSISITAAADAAGTAELNFIVLALALALALDACTNAGRPVPPLRLRAEELAVGCCGVECVGVSEAGTHHRVVLTGVK